MRSVLQLKTSLISDNNAQKELQALAQMLVDLRAKCLSKNVDDVFTIRSCCLLRFCQNDQPSSASASFTSTTILSQPFIILRLSPNPS